MPRGERTASMIHASPTVMGSFYSVTVVALGSAIVGRISVSNSAPDVTTV